VSLTYSKKRPTGPRVEFTVRAGTIPCESPANSPPTVSITAPAANSVFSSPATITVSAEALDADGTVTKVAFFANGSVIGTATSSPFAVQWSDAGPGSYSLTAVAIDNDGSQITSSPTAITITATRLLYFIHVDHLNTPRLVVNTAGTPVWQWDQLEAFGTNSAKTNAYDLYASDMPLRFPGQQYDVETTLHYNYFRHYDPNIGRYRESDPIGLMGGLNTYGYSEGSPTTKSDPRGLMATAIHVDLSREAMRAECPKLAGGAAYMSGGPADRGEGSQLPENARRHCMRTPGEDLQTGKSNHDAWVMSQLRQCTVPGLGKALHAVQDCYASGHKDYQTWDGHMTKTHAWGDVVGGRDAAIEASKALIRLFKEICPCMCQ
jgi:RHS repeat-associated protein